MYHEFRTKQEELKFAIKGFSIAFLIVILLILILYKLAS
jgi:hypothetical protein